MKFSSFGLNMCTMFDQLQLTSNKHRTTWSDCPTKHNIRLVTLDTHLGECYFPYTTILYAHRIYQYNIYDYCYSWAYVAKPYRVEKKVIWSHMSWSSSGLDHNLGLHISKSVPDSALYGLIGCPYLWISLATQGYERQRVMGAWYKIALKNKLGSAFENKEKWYEIKT